MSSFVSEFMGDPSSRHHAITDVLESRAIAQAEEERQIAEVREQLRQPKKTGPKGPRVPPPVVRPWITPTPSYYGMPIVAIERTGELRLRSVVRREMTKGQALHVRIAAQDGHLWIEPCRPDDPYARKVSQAGDIKGGSLRRELADAGFSFGRSYLIAREPDGCWVARADQPAGQGGAENG